MSPITYGYYPGCSQAASSVEYDSSVRAVSRILGIGLQEVPNWTCCGSTPAHTIDSSLSAALSARNLVQAKKAGISQVLSPCPSCVANLRTANIKMEHADFAEKTNRLLDEPYTGGVEAKSFLQVVFEEAGCEALAAKVTKPLKGLKVVAYYGCLTSRPTKIMSFDSEENPVSMDKLLAACGATVLDFPFKTECCGASVALSKTEVVPVLSGRILQMAQMVGADAVVVACPLCQVNLDLRRGQIEAGSGLNCSLPVFYFTQLLGLALGVSEAELGIEKLVVPPRAALDRIGTEPEAPARPAKAKAKAAPGAESHTKES